jgi:hypothetical protein
MNKKIFLMLLILPALLVMLTGCEKKTKTTDDNANKKEKIEIMDEKMGVKTTFEYNKNDFSNFKEDNSGASPEITFENEKSDIEFQMYHTSMSKKSYDISKSTRSAQKYYKEYKFGKYEAYAYGEYSSGLNLNILVNVDDEDYTNVLFVAIDRIDSNEDVVVADVFEEKVIQDFFNSINVEMSK